MKTADPFCGNLLFFSYRLHFLFFFISIIFINVTIVANLIYSDTLSNLIGSTMRRNRYMIYMLVAIVMVLIYYYVIRGIFSFNIYMMEGKNFRQS